MCNETDIQDGMELSYLHKVHNTQDFRQNRILFFKNYQKNIVMGSEV